MCTPDHFREPDAGHIARLTDEYGFGLLVSQMEGRPPATRLPPRYKTEDGARGGLMFDDLVRRSA